MAEVGYSKATIREIARMANVTSSSLYNYFPNKSELIKATISARADASMPRLRQAAQRPGNVIDRIEAVLDECGQLMREYPDLAAFEWAIRAENVMASGEWEEQNTGFETFREIIRVPRPYTTSSPRSSRMPGRMGCSPPASARRPRRRPSARWRVVCRSKRALCRRRPMTPR
ncbi:TetR/AcrR family transcriptional regulator [Mycobacterium sp. 1165178.9]|uniref:TetR/AcrR family transcriptional regulator n=1 Tax=Mycobacterium sp. 1165178.9 TaxID=1834070 RepID=UPI0035103BF0